MLTLNLTPEQVNQILNALAQQPYIQVHELIHTIRQQGEQQLQPPHESEETEDHTLQKSS